MKRIVFHVVIPLAILVVAAFLAKKIAHMAKPPERKTPDELAPAVETVLAEPRELTWQISATGSVVPAQKVTVTPEVNGRIVKMSPSLAPGAHFKKGAVIARLDGRDYKFALTAEESRVQQAELELKLESGRVEIAEHELKILERDKNSSQAVSQLARRTPQLKVAKQNTKSAMSGLERARLNLERTTIRAPFNGVVLEKHVDIGQIVGPQSPIVTLMGSDELWVELSVPVEKLQFIQIPGINGKEGSAVEITHAVGSGKNIVRSGHVIRLQGALDDKNRTATVLVSIDDPFNSEQSEIPLLAGAYVTASILCKDKVQGVELPRQALFNGTYLWGVGSDSRIKKHTVTVGWSTRDKVVIVGGLPPNSEIVVSPIAKPLEGMKVSPLAKNIAPSKSKDTGQKPGEPMGTPQAGGGGGNDTR